MKIFYLTFAVLLVLFTNSFFAQDYWEQTNGPYGGKITQIIICPDGDVFAAVPEGLYHSTDNGVSWLNKYKPMGKIINLSCSDSGYLYIFLEFAWAASRYSDYYIIKSTDKGDNWNYLKFNFRGSFNVKHAATITPNGYFFIGRKDLGILRSTDNGESWQEVNNTLMTKDIVCLTNNSSGHVFAGTSMGVFRSTDYGDSWIRLNTGLTNTDIRTILVNSSENIFVGTYGGGVFRSMDNGINWTQINSNLTIPYISYLAADSTGNIFAGTYQNGVFRSTDNGNYWTHNNYGLTDNRISCIAGSNNKNIFLGTDGTGIFRSVDSGNNWMQAGLIRTQVITMATAKNENIFAGLDGAGIAMSTDNGNTWISKSTGINIPFIKSITFSQDGNIFATSLGSVLGGAIFKSTDNGNSWTSIALLGGSISCLTISKKGTMFVGTGGGVFRSTNNGNSWNQTPLNQGDVGKLLSVDDDVLASFIGGGIGAVFRSTDDGLSWEKVLDKGFQNFEINSQKVVFAGNASYELYRSEDNGKSWEKLNIIDSSENFAMKAILFNSEDYIYVASGSKVYISKDSGKSWEKISAIISGYGITSLVTNSSGYIFAGTSYGVFRIINPIASGIQLNEEPLYFSLLQNYPNPFNPVTKIKYSITRQSFVTLRVYDLLGREVEALVNEEKSMGSYEVEFDGSNLTSGIYFYKIQAGNYSEVKKMILIK